VAALANASSNDALLKGIMMAADSIAGGLTKRGDRSHERHLRKEDREFRSGEAEKNFLRDVTLEEIRAGRKSSPDNMTEAQRLDAEIKRITLQNLQRRQKYLSDGDEEDLIPQDYDPLDENARFTGTLDDVPLPGDDYIVDQSGLPPVEPDLPSPDDELLPPVDSQGQPSKRQRKLSSDGRFEEVTFPDGSTQLKDLAKDELVGQRRYPSQPVPEDYTLDSITVDSPSGRKTYKKPETDALAEVAAPTPPPGTRLKGARMDAQGRETYEFEPDTTQEELAKDISRFKAAMDESRRVIEDIDRVIEIAEGSTLPSLGKMSKWVAALPINTAANDVRLLLKNIQANTAFKTLSDMRQNSPTGGALGAISDKELGLLSAAEGTIDPDLSPEEFVRNLKRIRDARSEALSLYQDRTSKIEAKMQKEEGPSSGASSSSAKAVIDEANSIMAGISKLPVGSPERSEALAKLKQLAQAHLRMTGKPLPR
jgi:hypothetical protein